MANTEHFRWAVGDLRPRTDQPCAIFEIVETMHLFDFGLGPIYIEILWENPDLQHKHNVIRGRC